MTMTSVSDIYGAGGSGDYLKAADLKKKTVKVTIAPDWTVKEFDETSREGQPYKAKKIILSFVGKEKKLVVNKTNATAIEYAFGPVEQWAGKEIELYPTMVPMGDGMVEAIRVRPITDATEGEEIPW